ncbi:MAG: mannose-1-phosphate guanylyltransferase, partial [Gammaproteobacteria bacterium]
EPFLVVNGDIATDFPFRELKSRSVDMAHLILVDNPDHHAEGDFGLDNRGRVIENGLKCYTFSGIGLYRPELFANLPAGVRKLGPLLREAIARGQVSGQKFSGFWMDIGTEERLQKLELYYQQREQGNE